MADGYDYLTEGERAYWDIFTRLRQLSDWTGFTTEQRDRKEKAKAWLQKRRTDIEAAAQESHDWKTNNRRARYNFLADKSLNSGSPRRLTQLPTDGSSPGEKSLISEREVWWRVTSVDDQTHAWRVNNVNEMTTLRKQIYTLAGQETWDKLNRRQRWENLCVATKTGKAYDRWKETHNPITGVAKPTTTDRRAQVVKHARSFVGVSESPPNSNKGMPHPSDWERRVIGADGFAWCACFATCMAWDVGVKGASSAGVIVCIDMAQKGEGIFKGWTTDPRRARQGDFAIIACNTCHMGIVAENNDPYHTIEGNTSPTSAGSQFNGGCVAEKHRPHDQVIGWCLVDYSS
jgi:hypothetical protein